jgi:hypothetical protein
VKKLQVPYTFVTVGRRRVGEPTWNLQNVKDKHAYQPAKTRATPYRIRVSSPLDRRGWKKLVFKKYYVSCSF